MCITERVKKCALAYCSQGQVRTKKLQKCKEKVFGNDSKLWHKIVHKKGKTDKLKVKQICWKYFGISLKKNQNRKINGQNKDRKKPQNVTLIQNRENTIQGKS